MVWRALVGVFDRVEENIEDAAVSSETPNRVIDHLMGFTNPLFVSAFFT
jgi:hypothetical protein